MIYCIKIYPEFPNITTFYLYKTTFYFVICEIIEQQIVEAEFFETFVTYDDRLE